VTQKSRDNRADYEGYPLRNPKVKPPRTIQSDPAPRLAYNGLKMKATKPLTIESIDVENDRELDALMSHVLAEGNKIYQKQRKEAIRLGIIDEKGNLLKRELPEDMREDAGTDFGG
jgi:hypothetical protein